MLNLARCKRERERMRCVPPSTATSDSHLLFTQWRLPFAPYGNFIYPDSLCHCNTSHPLRNTVSLLFHVYKMFDSCVASRAQKRGDAEQTTKSTHPQETMAGCHVTVDGNEARSSSNASSTKKMNCRCSVLFIHPSRQPGKATKEN